ncbi:MAG: sensory transduction histidine kinase [Bacteroidetes bacterium]|nr:sensory transduction histidine kinase [Bacteroidota bacterium]
MSIERKIHFKAIVLYIIAGAAVIAMIIFLYGLKMKISGQKDFVEKQYKSLILTNELVVSVGQAQSAASMYVSTKDAGHIDQFRKHLVRVDSLVSLLETVAPLEKDKLKGISVLLNKQATNITELNRRFSDDNPVNSINERLQNYEPPKQKSVKIVTVKKDTVFRSIAKKSFFRRIREVFSPVVDSTMIVANQRTDTLKISNADSIAILSEVDKIARAASVRYDRNIRAIEQQVTELIVNDREISGKVSSLIMELQQGVNKSVLDTIAQSEQSINSNYTLSIAGGLIALLLILLFVILIIADVNQGKKAREKIKQIMDTRHQLLLSVSHDIKSPLTSILGYVAVNKHRNDEIESVENSARYIFALLENLLEFTSLERGELTTTFTDFSLNNIGRETEQMFKPMAGAKHLTLKCESDKVRVNTDMMKTKQIIINLVSNSIKYTKEGTITLQLTYKDGNIEIYVEDTGVGIPESKLPEIYKPFVRVESNNALAHGSGLGMYVVKGLVGLLKGSISITSVVNKGTAVRVIIPAVKSAFAIPGGKKRIEVYDDDPAVLHMTKSMLGQLGHVIVEHHGDVILTDMEMGAITGLDILAKAGNTPVVVMTGRSDFNHQKALELGFDGYLPKPFSTEDLRNLFGQGDTMAEDDLLGDDREEIMEIFRTSTAENFGKLKTALVSGDFKSAQALCHKMLPMFAQLGYPVEELRRIDSHRTGEYDGWKEDVEKILSVRV